MAFVIRFATHTVEIWLKQQSPLRWGPLEEAQHYHTEADAHRAIARLWLRGVTIQDLGHAGRVIHFPKAKVRLRRDEGAGRFPAPPKHGNQELITRRANDRTAASAGGASGEMTLARYADPELVTPE
jgi:hypothetical protein